MLSGNKDLRKRQYLNSDGADKPLKSPLPHSTLKVARAWRLERLRTQLHLHDCAAILLYDPVNIRYAFDITNMQVWTAHNAMRYALIFTTGPSIMFEFKGAEHLCNGIDAIDEVRNAISWIFMSAGDKSDLKVNMWAQEIADLIRQHSDGNHRLAIDKIEPLGLKALEKLGIEYVEGQAITETARSIKSDEELELMQWTIRVCEAGMARIYENSVPGKTENELWAELQFENARSGGEWLETRLLACGDHTNPWYAECSHRVCQLGEMISFDTDLIGPYGYCADLSRSWTCGYTPMNDQQKRLYSLALEQINHNLEIIEIGMTFEEFNRLSWKIPEKHQPYRYSLAVHGVGMADEWPVIPLHVDFKDAQSGQFEKNMTVCVESLMAERGSESIKLETQVLITDKGAIRMDSFPWERIE